MPVMLRNQEGYYSRVVEVDGSKFYIADLGEHYEEFVERNAALVAASGLEPSGRDMSAVLSELVARAAEPAVHKKLRGHMAEFVGWILSVGLVKWDLPAELTPESRLLLPARVQSELARAVVAESDLTLTEGDFLGRLGAGPGQR